MRTDSAGTNEPRRGFARLCANVLGKDSVISVFIFVVVAVFVASIGAFFWHDVRVKRTLREQAAIHNIRSVGGVLAETAEALLAADELSTLRRIVMETGSRHNLKSCRVSLPDGAILADAAVSRIDASELPESWSSGATEYSERRTENEIFLSYPLHIPGRGTASLELASSIDNLPQGYSEPLPIDMAMAGVALIAILLVHRHSRRSLKAITAIRETLLEANKSDVEISTLQVDPELGDEAIAWNRLLFEQEQHDTHGLMARISESVEAGAAGGMTVAGVCGGLPHGVIIIGENTEIEYANGAAAVLFQTNRSDFEGSELKSLVCDERLSGMMHSALSGSATRSATTEVIREGSTSAGVLKFTVCPLVQRGRSRAVIMVEDVSQQKVAQEARNSFLAHATHELRTPLTNIQLYVESALETCETDPATTAGHLDVINRECRRLGRTVSEILSASQIEAGSLDLDRDDVRMDDLFAGVQADYEAYAMEKQIDLKFDLPPKLPVLQADRDQILLALHNILGNAIKYTPHGGRVSVGVRVEEDKIEIEVRDTGIGIGVEDLDRIFERFYRAQDERLDKIVGSGLGLSIAREVVRLHSGDIHVESELNKGSTFTLILPISEELIHNGDRSTTMRRS